ISERRKGAHDATLLCDPDQKAIEALLDAAPGTLAILTLAPERAGALDAIRRLTASGVLVSVGHSDATADVVAAASAAGARLVTPLLNAPRPPPHPPPRGGRRGGGPGGGRPRGHPPVQRPAPAPPPRARRERPRPGRPAAHLRPH